MTDYSPGSFTTRNKWTQINLEEPSDKSTTIRLSTRNQLTNSLKDLDQERLKQKFFKNRGSLNQNNSNSNNNNNSLYNKYNRQSLINTLLLSPNQVKNKKTT